MKVYMTRSARKSRFINRSSTIKPNKNGKSLFELVYTDLPGFYFILRSHRSQHRIAVTREPQRQALVFLFLGARLGLFTVLILNIHQ